MLFHPLEDKKWKHDVKRLIEILTSRYPDFLKKLMLNRYLKYVRYSLYPIYGIVKAGKWIINPFGDAGHEHHDEQAHHNDHVEHGAEPSHGIEDNFLKKVEHPGYEVAINILYAGEDGREGRIAIKEIASTLSIFSHYANNTLKLKTITRDAPIVHAVKKRVMKRAMVLNSKELAGLVHLPTSYVKTPAINWLSSRSFEPPANLPVVTGNHKTEITPL